jgi:hypothetical protein
MRPASGSSDIASPRRRASNADDDLIVDRRPVKGAMETLSTASGDNPTDLVFDMDSLNRQASVQGLLGTLLFDT